jgi:enoyl-CoA hydratase
MVADVGTLQRLPKLVGSQGLVRELAYTGRAEAAEAREIGLVNRVFDSREALQAGCARSPRRSPPSRRCIRGTKEMLNYARDHRWPTA